jgi:hypothetical protein
LLVEAYFVVCLFDGHAKLRGAVRSGEER